MRLICKIFHSACYMGVPDLLLEPGPFTGWMDCLQATCLLPEPQVGSLGSPRFQAFFFQAFWGHALQLQASSALLASVCKTWLGHLISLAGWNWCYHVLVLVHLVSDVHRQLSVLAGWTASRPPACSQNPRWDPSDPPGPRLGARMRCSWPAAQLVQGQTSSALLASVCKAWPELYQVEHLISLAGWHWCSYILGPSLHLPQPAFWAVHTQQTTTIQWLG